MENPPDRIELPSTQPSNVYLQPIKLFQTEASLLSINSQTICLSSSHSISVYNYKQDSSQIDPQLQLQLSCPSPPKDLLLSKNSNFLAILGQDFLQVYNIDDNQELLKVSKSSPIECIKWHPIQTGVFFTLEQDEIQIWTLDGGSFGTQTIKKPNILGFDVGPSNQYELSVVSAVGKVKFWSPLSSEQRELGHVEFFESVVYIDCDTIAVASHDVLNLFTRNGGRLYTINRARLSVDIYKELYALFSSINTLELMNKQELLANQRAKTIYVLDQTPKKLCLRFNQESVVLFVLVQDSFQYYLLEKQQKNLKQIFEQGIQEFTVQDTKVQTLKPEPRKQKRQKRQVKEIKDPLLPLMNSLHKKLQQISQRVQKQFSEKNLQTVVTKSMQAHYQKTQQEKTIKTTLQNSVAASFRNQFTNSLLPKFQADLMEGFNRMNVLMQDTLRLNAERNARQEAKSRSLNLHMKTAIENITNLTKKISKVSFKHMKKVNQTESKLIDKIQNMEKQNERNIQVPQLKTELDQLLMNQQYDGAIKRVLQENKAETTYKVLNCINPKILVQNKLLQVQTADNLFKQLLDNVQNSHFDDFEVWIESLIQVISITQNNEVFQKLCDAAKTNSSLWNAVRSYSMKTK